jgi:mRNA-degrading endonuclease RelE of RelBE toxin-antitoxin system
MKHRKSEDFRRDFDALPAEIRALAEKNFRLLKNDPGHRGLRLKKVGPYWSARIGRSYRALAVERPYGLLWFWIGHHSDYERLIG